jgi:hypothetical protein
MIKRIIGMTAIIASTNPANVIFHPPGSIGFIALPELFSSIDIEFNQSTFYALKHPERVVR